jgi:predicted DsbA family dithiol-disulfide isomerase
MERTHKDAVDADWALARSYGITGVPSFIAGGRKVVGAQPYSTLEKLIAIAS